MESTDRKSELIMKLKKANCHNCYKCVRACPVNAISILGDQAKIEESLCIYCGICYEVCPQEARDLLGDLMGVRSMIAKGEKVYFSLSSTFPSYFRDAGLKNMGAALKKLGAERVEETAIGGNRVMEEYLKIINKGELQNIISTLCPSANFMIQKHNPELVKWMVPVETPLEAHARMMRAAYGEDIRVVGIGPCIAYHKWSDLSDDGNLIDAYLTYEELEKWMKAEGVEITDKEDPETYPVSNYRGRYVDEVGGMFRALPSGIKYKYKTWDAHGADDIKKMFSGIDENIENYCFSISSCPNSCLSGPIIRLLGKDDFKGKDNWMMRLKDGIDSPDVNPSELVSVDVSKTYERMDVVEPTPSEEDIQYFLSLIGRDRPEKQLDCGGCGYSSCREKAIAVYKGFADPFMCIPHARDKAEAQSNLLFDYSPSGVVVMDFDLNILEINPVAERIFNLKKEDAPEHNAREFMGSEFLDRACIMSSEVVRDTVECEPIGKLLSVTFFRVERHNIIMMVLDDRTEAFEKYQNDKRMKEETIDITQHVVEKQMRIAQEIASLLGETTAETKLAFNNLRNILTNEKDGWQ